jgi:hypothetical protein
MANDCSWAPRVGKRAAAAERRAEPRANVFAARPRACIVPKRNHASRCEPAAT